MPGQFKINISGQEIERGNFNKLVNIMQPRLRVFAPGSEINLYDFARLNYRIEIIGEKMKFDMLDNVVKTMKQYIEKYLRRWKYDIEINYIETGGENGKTS